MSGHYRGPARDPDPDLVQRVRRPPALEDDLGDPEDWPAAPAPHERAPAAPERRDTGAHRRADWAP